MPGFQTSVNEFCSIGIPGEPYRDGPMVADTYTLESSGTPNIIGATAYTISAQGTATAGGTGVFAGILANPKSYATAGTSGGGALAPTMQLPDGVQAELVTECSAGFVVNLPAAASIGDNLVFNNSTGALSTVAAGSAVPGGYTLVYGGTVAIYTVSAAGPAVVRLTGQILNNV